MINGLGSQCIDYHEEGCARFVAAGFHVIRFDKRDVWLSTHFTDADLDEHGAACRLADMADDAIAELVPGARFVPIDGMGHDSPRELWSRWVDEVAAFCRHRSG